VQSRNADADPDELERLIEDEVRETGSSFWAAGRR
jgi:hypothetical protein